MDVGQQKQQQQQQQQQKKNGKTGENVIATADADAGQQHNDGKVPRKDEKLMNNLLQQIPDVDNIFVVHRKIGHGTFSKVYLATLKRDEKLPLERKKQFAIKHIIPTSHPARIERELRCMQEIGGACNVVSAVLCLRRHESVAFVMPYIPHDQFQHYFDKMLPAETQLYLRNLLIAIKRVHDFRIIHRDVKPSNFLYNRKTQQFLLVDFGLAQAERDPPVDANKTAKRRLSGGAGNEPNSSTSQQQQEQPRQPQPQQPTPAPPPQQQKRQKLGTGSGNRENALTVEVVRQLNAVFKTPLKQSNRIVSPLKLSNITKDLYSPPLARQIKSTVLGISSNLKKASSHPPKKTPPGPASGPAGRSDAPPSGDNRTAKLAGTVCECFGKGQVCNVCLVKKEIQAPRAGTPGYRPPEVLLKYPDQTTAVDIWAVGVMFISILSRCYPFFKHSDDLLSLGEIICVFGDQRVKKTGMELQRTVIMPARKQQPLDLRKLCLRLRNGRRRPADGEPAPGPVTFGNICDNCEQLLDDCLCENTSSNRDFTGDDYSDAAYDLLRRLLEVNPHKRITAAEALQHRYFQECY